MIRKNITLTSSAFLLRPAGKDYLWGGTRLRDEFAKELAMTPLAETWECSTHPDGMSIVESGAFEGLPLVEVLRSHPSMLGRYANEKGQLPILIKFIDAAKDLSVQVHPDDTYARIHEHGLLGKSELWYVIDATNDARLIYGFTQNMEKETLRKSLSDGTVKKYLNQISIKKGDVFYIPAGTVHAIGAGALIAEIQENSNLTYRMYDYNRVDQAGKKRELHIEKALEVVRRSRSTKPERSMNVYRYEPGLVSELLCRCQYFQVEQLHLNTECTRSMAEVRIERDSFQVLLCLEGCGLLYDRELSLPYFKGDCIFIPAGAKMLQLHGRAKLLAVRC